MVNATNTTILMSYLVSNLACCMVSISFGRHSGLPGISFVRHGGRGRSGLIWRHRRRRRRRVNDGSCILLRQLHGRLPDGDPRLLTKRLRSGRLQQDVRDDLKDHSYDEQDRCRHERSSTRWDTSTAAVSRYICGCAQNGGSNEQYHHYERKEPASIYTVHVTIKHGLSKVSLTKKTTVLRKYQELFQIYFIEFGRFWTDLFYSKNAV